MIYPESASAMIDPQKAPIVNQPLADSSRGLTLLQLAAAMKKEPPGAVSQSVPPIFHVLVRTWNEQIREDRLERYRPVAKAIASAKSTEALDTRRAWRCIDWAVRTFTAEYVDLIGWPDHASRLREVESIVDRESLQAAQSALADVAPRAALVVEAAGALKNVPGLPMSHVFERSARKRFASAAKALGRSHTDLEDARPYPGYDALAFTGLRSVNMVVRWPELAGVRCPEILPTLSIAERVQMAGTMGASRDRAEALTFWLCDSFASLIQGLARMRK